VYKRTKPTNPNSSFTSFVIVKPETCSTHVLELVGRWRLGRLEARLCLGAFLSNYYLYYSLFKPCIACVLVEEQMQYVMNRVWSIQRTSCKATHNTNDRTIFDSELESQYCWLPLKTGTYHIAYILWNKSSDSWASYVSSRLHFRPSHNKLSLSKEKNERKRVVFYQHLQFCTGENNECSTPPVEIGRLGHREPAEKGVRRYRQQSCYGDARRVSEWGHRQREALLRVWFDLSIFDKWLH
jgi:hypothetical protein